MSCTCACIAVFLKCAHACNWRDTNDVAHARVCTYSWRKVREVSDSGHPTKMLARRCLFANLLLSFHFYVKVSSVCVARLHSGDVFVNEGGAIATCAEYGATCALGSELDGGAEGDGIQCGCDVSEVLVPCPACRCNTIHPVFNGTSCKPLRAHVIMG